MTIKRPDVDWKSLALKYEAALARVFEREGWVWIAELLPVEVVEEIKAQWRGENP